MSIQEKLRPAARGRRLLTTAALTAASLLATTTVAHANASPPFLSSYLFDAQLTGATNFSVVTNPTVTVALQGTSGPSRVVKIQVERRACSFFFCGGSTVGGDCIRTLFVGAFATCNFNVPISNELHRIVMTKNFDGATIAGNIQVF